VVQNDNKTMFTQNSNDPPVLGYLRTQQNNIPRVTHTEYTVPAVLHPVLCPRFYAHSVEIISCRHSHRALKITRSLILSTSSTSNPTS